MAKRIPENDPDLYNEYKEQQEADIEFEEARQEAQRLDEEYEDPIANKQYEDAERAAAIERALSPLQESYRELNHQSEELQADILRDEYERSTDGKIAAKARERMARTGETFEAAQANLVLENPDLYEASKRDQDANVLFQDIQRKKQNRGY